MNTLALMAVAPIHSWGFLDLAIAVIVIAAVVGIVYAALQYMGVTIPAVVLRIFGIVLVAILAIFAIKLIADAW